MKRWTSISKICLAFCLVLLMLSGAAAGAESLFPSPDELFGVTMPDIRYAVGRDADEKEEAVSGRTFVYASFTVGDYVALDAYLAAAGMKVRNHSLKDGVLTVALTKDGAEITLRYGYGERKASMVYPAGTRLEKEARNTGKGSILPELRTQFGTSIPDLSEQLPLHPKARMARENDMDVILYAEVSRADYAIVNRYLTTLKYEAIEWHADDGVLYATITDGRGAMTVRYEMQEQRFSIICPELYYIDAGRKVSVAENTDLILPDLQEAMGAILPRISSALLRYPDATENTEDTCREVYNNFGPEDYAVFSAYLTDKGCAVGNYYINTIGELVIPLSIMDTEFTFTYDQLGNRAVMDYPVGAQLEPVFAASAAATPTPRPTSVPTAAPKPTEPPKKYSPDECWYKALNYFNNLSWKNPSSVTVHGHTTSMYDGGYLFMIDYSAMNGFGGYNRETYMIKVNYTTGRIEFAWSY